MVSHIESLHNRLQQEVLLSPFRTSSATPRSQEPRPAHSAHRGSRTDCRRDLSLESGRVRVGNGPTAQSVTKDNIGAVGMRALRASSVVVPAIVLGGLGFMACGGSSAVPPSQPQHQHAIGPEGTAAGPAAQNEVLNVTGHERFGWTQPADSAAGHKFAVYIDGARRELPDAACQAPASGRAECSAQLPAVSPGRHTLEIVAWTTSDGQLIESARSSPMTIEMSGSHGATSKDR
jgi:hypothetical protein